MAILIDGYNLLNATGVEGTGSGTELARARRGLLQFLAETLSIDEQDMTTIVFDAQGAPPGLPPQQSFHGITVLFSRGYAEADDLLEELIEADHVPRKLTVVSSDHRLHRAARRRKATAVDSEVWIAQLQMRSGEPHASSGPQKPVPSDELTDSWLAEFADVDVAEIESELTVEKSAAESPSDDAQSEVQLPSSDKRHEEPPRKDGVELLPGEDDDKLFPDDFGSELNEDDGDDIYNPFPPGYGDDLFEN